MSGKCRPSLREKTLYNVDRCNLSQTDKDCIKAVFELTEKQKAEIESIYRKVNGEINILLAERDVAKQEVNRLSVMVIELQKQLKTAKAEAVKEFAERLKAEYADFDEKYETILPENINKTIDDLLAEAPNGEITKNE